MVGVKSYRAIKQLSDLMETRPDITFFMFECINPPLISFNFHKNKDIIINRLIELGAAEISAWILDEPNESDEYFIYINNYTEKDISASVIQQSWKKNRWNYLRNLAEIKYHPSKITFNVD